jgi:integrase/recombinase XerD
MTREYKNQQIIGNPANPESLYYYMLRFTQWCGIQHRSKVTIKSWEIYLRRFIRWCDERGLQNPQEITKPILERYQRHLFLYRQANGQPLSVSGQMGYLTAIRAYFKWLTRANHILYNPASELDLPKMNKRLPKVTLSIDEAETVINQADITTTAGLRDRTMMEVLYSTGIRRKELTNLQTTDVDINRGILMIRHGKGDKDRMIPIGERAIDWILKYLNESRPELVIGMSDNMLFINSLGKAVGTTWLSRLITKYFKQADIGKMGSCHTFRHTMATLMLENGADIRYIQSMLGHANLETTQIYTKVSIKKLKDIHTATHPAKNQKPREPETKY